MNEKRIYVVSSVNEDKLYCMSKEDFINEAESQGYVYSSWEYFVADYNLGYLPSSETSIIRVY